MEKKKRRLNIVDIVVIVVILAAAVFFGWKLTHRGGDSGAQARPGTIIRYSHLSLLKPDSACSLLCAVPVSVAL